MTQPNFLRKFVTSAGAAALLAGGSLFAGDYGKVVIDDKAPVEGWHFCDIFDMNTLYESDSGFVRKVKFIGRYQGQIISQQEDVFDPLGINTARNGFHQYQVRRFRVGADIGLAHNLSFKTNFNISDSGGANRGVFRNEFFNSIDEMVLEWEPDHYVDPKAPVRNFRLNYIAVGKMKQKITREYSTSSKRILTIERSQIVNEVISSKPWGVTIGFEFGGIEQEIGGWIYGIHNDFGLNNRLNFPNSHSRGGLTYRASKEISDITEVFFDYQFTNNSSGFARNFQGGVSRAGRGNANAGLGSAYEHVIALGSENDFGRLQLTTDLIFAANREVRNGNQFQNRDIIAAGNDTWGFVILPTYDITEKLQAVFKYAYSDSGRQERTQRFSTNPGGVGNTRFTYDDYHTFYAGLNYYICEHNLKIMAGYEYATGEIYGVNGSDIDSSTWMLGFRTYF